MKCLRVLLFIVLLLLTIEQLCMAETTGKDITFKKVSSTVDVDYEEYKLYGASISGKDQIAMLLRHNHNEWLITLFGSDGLIKYRYCVTLSDKLIAQTLDGQVYFDRYGGLHCLFAGRFAGGVGESIIVDLFDNRAAVRKTGMWFIEDEFKEYAFSEKITSLIDLKYNRHFQSTLQYQKIQPYVLTIVTENNSTIELFYSDSEYRRCKRNSYLEPIITGGVTIVVLAVILRYKVLEKRNKRNLL